MVYPKGMEPGSYQILLQKKAARYPLLAGLPSRFFANLSHGQSVLSLTAGAKVLPSSEHDPHQILAYGDKVITVQFHPEFDAAIMQGIMTQHTADLLPKSKPPCLGLPVQDTPLAASILQRFVHQVAAGI